MNNLRSTRALVRYILQIDPKSRNSDYYLYLKVLSHVAKEKSIDLHSLSVPYFLMVSNKLGFPPFESVRRSRQLMQAQFPELASSEEVEAYREENEEEYREFSKEIL